MRHLLPIALLALAAGATHAQTTTPAAAPVSAAKKELIAKVVKLHMPALENMGRTLAEQPAQQVMLQVRNLLPRVAADKRESLAKEVEGDIRKYVDEAVPIVRERAVAIGPSVLTPLLEQRFSEDELKQLAALLESPLNAKYQAFAVEIQRTLGPKLVAESRGAVEPKVKVMEEAVSKRLRAAAPPASGAK